MKARYFRKRALSALKEHWGVAIAVTLIALLLGGSLTSPVSSITASFSSVSYSGRVPIGGSSIRELMETVSRLWNSLLQTISPGHYSSVSNVLSSILTVLGLVAFVIGGAVSLGHARFHLLLQDGRKPAFKALFSGMDHIGKGFLMRLLTFVYLLLWTLLLVIPGIIKSFSYAMTPYILAEHPDMGVNDAITLSRKMMSGHKWRLFCLKLSFIGWAILSFLSFGIGFLWLNPYVENAHAAFYRHVSAPFFPAKDTAD